MAQPRLPELYLECRYAHHQAEAALLDVHEPDSPELPLELNDAAGCSFASADEPRGLIWTIDQKVGPMQKGCKHTYKLLRSPWEAVVRASIICAGAFKAAHQFSWHFSSRTAHRHGAVLCACAAAACGHRCLDCICTDSWRLPAQHPAAGWRNRAAERGILSAHRPEHR